MKNSPYGKSIALHVETDQIRTGSYYYNFEAITSKGEPFSLSSLVGRKSVLLLYGGLGCMGNEGRDFLAKLYDETTRENFEIVVFWSLSELKELQEIDSYYPSPYISVSDFKGDHTPMKILYGAQATPTCFLINKEGIVIIRSEGLPTGKLKELLNEGKLN